MAEQENHRPERAEEARPTTAEIDEAIDDELRQSIINSLHELSNSAKEDRGRFEEAVLLYASHILANRERDSVRPAAPESFAMSEGAQPARAFETVVAPKPISYEELRQERRMLRKAQDHFNLLDNSDAISLGIRLLHFLIEQMEKGSTILLRYKDGSLQELVIEPTDNDTES